MVKLPNDFMSRMKTLLGTEYGEFESSYQQPHFRGLRWNPLKCSSEILETSLGFPLSPAPFSKFSTYISQDVKHIGTHPLHHAGAFYMQEPSASSAVTVLDPQPGEMVLDLCAAPGGKSTQIAGILNGNGLLWSNEVVKSRASILVSNLERMGVTNAVVSSCHPDTLCSSLVGRFDRVLVDAPCSGEGMFRREEQAAQEWSLQHVIACAERQKAILNSASQAVCNGGVLVYSTCTFSYEENEAVVQSFLNTHNFELECLEVPFGRPGIGMPEVRRIYPMDGGEGHFVAKMRKKGLSPKRIQPMVGQQDSSCKPGAELYESLFRTKLCQNIAQFGSRFVILPDNLPPISSLGVIRAGVVLGEIKTGRIEPEHALFMAAKSKELKMVLDFSIDSPQIAAFLRGEELEIEDSYKGYVGVSIHGIMLGFGKCSNGRLKNRYPKGLRNLH